jgi:hypothetical protein
MQSLKVLPALLVLLAPLSAHSQDFVALPPGETPLCDIGIYRIAYQSYGGKIVEMPPSWTGMFESVSGISYQPNEFVLGRNALLLHSPWHIPPGRVFIDYPLSLPKLTPIKLSFGITMSPEAAAPGHSDGVTFSAYLVDGGVERELMRKNYTAAEWIDYSFDLSAYAGKTVTIRLQAEPGPKNDPSFDFSYFGDAKITAGSATDSRKALLDRLTSSKAYRATADASLVPLANSDRNGITPSNLLPCRNAITHEGDAYRFSYDAADCKLVYTYQPKTGTLDDFTVRVDDGRVFQPAVGGGAAFLLGSGSDARDFLARGGKRASAALVDDGRALEVKWDYDAGGTPVRIAWRFEIVGKALVIGATCDTPVVSGFNLGNIGQVPLRRMAYIPYLPADWSRGAVNYLPAEGLYAARYLDWTVSHSSACPQGVSRYEAKTDGTRNPMVEKGYVAVSPTVGEVLPNAPFAPSPYLKVLAPCPMLDIWSHHNGTYQGDADNLRALKDNGVDHLVIIQHDWQRYGYDTKLPDHMPANPGYGGDEGMIAFGKAAGELGFRWSLHENYIDLYPDAPSYDPAARVIAADGSPSKAWFNGSVQSYGLKTTRALGYAKMNSPQAHARYGTSAAYLDVHTCVPPWHQLDHEAGQDMAAMALAKVKYDGELFQYMRDSNEGPLFGEGANQFYWAGRADGVEAQIAGGEDNVPFLDFDLLKLHPQMMNHGMGYMERWYRQGYNHRLGIDSGTPEQVDKYRAQEIAYGHAGFIGSENTDNIQWVAKEYGLVHPVQALYGAAKVTSISYEVDGRFVSGSVALAMGEPWRQRIKYDSGLTVWVNWSPQPWTVEGRILPQWGFLALGPKTDVCTSMRDGKFADFANCPDYLFADARTYFNMPYLVGGKAITPRLRDFKYLGDGTIRVTYEWTINDTLDRDFTSFVHLRNDIDTRNQGIVGQQDHGFTKPTSQWRKGEVFVDGPYDIKLPPDKYDTYDLVIGLYNGSVGRVPLRGIKHGDNAYLLGRLMIKRDGANITDVSLGDLSADLREQEDSRKAFAVHMNPAGTMIDFGPLATDGSVKVEKHPGSLVVFPYPRERAFTVKLNLKAILPGTSIDGAKVQVRALAAGTQKDLGQVQATCTGGVCTFKVGLTGAGRYVVTW